MRRRRSHVIILSALLALQACSAPPAAVDRPTGRGGVSAKGKGTPAPGEPAAATPDGAAPAASTAPAPAPVAEAAATSAPGQADPQARRPILPEGRLVGIVRVPLALAGDKAGIIGNNGGSIIGNNGGSIIGNNGGSLIGKTRLYRTLAAEVRQVPLAGVTVALLDAGGKPLRRGDGTAITAVTDEFGLFGIKDELPAGNVLAVADLPDGKGQVQAIVANREGDAREVELDLISTLTTAYIVDQYVRPQPIDPQTTLNKLPPAVELETRAKAIAAFLAHGGPVPASLRPPEVVATVTTLRGKDASFDQQLETVKKLLVVAGQRDLGAGRPALEVGLGDINHLLPAPDGSLFIATGWDARIWKLGRDGKLYTYAGHGKGLEFRDERLDGKPAHEAGFGVIDSLWLDREGRLLVVESGIGDRGDRISRVEPDGRLTEVWAAQDFPVGATREYVIALIAGAGDALTAMTNLGTWALAAGKQPVRQREFAEPDRKRLEATYQAGVDAKGRVALLAWAAPPAAGCLRFDPATGTFSQVAFGPTGEFPAFSVDPAGNFFHYEPGGQLRRIDADDRATTVFERVPAPLPEDYVFGRAVMAAMPDGAVVVSSIQTNNDPGQEKLVYRLHDGKAARFAGTLAPTSTGEAGEIAFKELHGVLALPGGDVLAGDATTKQILRVTPDGKSSSFAEGVGMNAAGPVGLRRDGAGNIYAAVSVVGFDANRVFKLGPTGEKLEEIAFDKAMDDMVVAPDGTIYYVFFDYSILGGEAGSETFQLVRRRPDGTRDVLYSVAKADEDPAGSRWGLALAPDGAVWFIGGKKLRKWSAVGGVEVVDQGDELLLNDGTAYGECAIDPRGRFYFCDRFTIKRYVPASDRIEAIAGSGTPRFGGTTVDESIRQPQGLSFDAAGNLYFADSGHRQIKRIAASEL